MMVRHLFVLKNEEREETKEFFLPMSFPKLYMSLNITGVSKSTMMRFLDMWNA
jgi:hypothetical protein